MTACDGQNMVVTFPIELIDFLIFEGFSFPKELGLSFWQFGKPGSPPAKNRKERDGDNREEVKIRHLAPSTRGRNEYR